MPGPPPSAGSRPRGRRERGLGAVICVALLSPGAPVSADATEDITLRWEAHEGCPDAEAVRAEVRRLLGEAARAQAPLSVDAVVTRDDAGSHLSLTLEGGESAGRRELSAARCDELASATALIVALAVDPEAVDPAALEQLEGATQEAPRETTEPAPIPAATRAPPETATEASAGPAPHLSAAAAFILDAGSLPSIAPGLDAALGFRLARTRLEVGVTYLLPNDAETGGRRPAAELRLLAGKLAVCQTLLGERRSLAACAAAELGSLMGSGGDITERRDGSSLWLAAHLSLTGALPIVDGLALQGGLGVALPLRRPVFTVENLGPVHQPSSIGGRLWLGLRVES